MSRQRKRIQKAVELRGFAVKSLDWHPWYNAGEKMGIGGGWTLALDRKWMANSWPGDDLHALSADEMLAYIDWALKPAEACECSDAGGRGRLTPLKGDPERPLHEPGCRWRVDYRLPWWKRGAQS